ncbi:hypothetical protein IV102_04445 [bacterium]|nr:hypothetical protein [bacterium]
MHRTTQRLLALLLTWLVVMLPVQAQAPPDLARLIDVLEWVIEVPLTDGQRQELSPILTSLPPARLQQLSADADQLAPLLPQQRSLLRPKMRSQLLGPADLLGQWLQRTQAGAGQIVVAGEPPLTQQSLAAFCEWLLFTIDPTTSPIPSAPMASTLEGVLSGLYPDLNPGQRAQLASLPQQWAGLRKRWPALSSAERDQLCAQWRIMLGPLLGRSQKMRLASAAVDSLSKAIEANADAAGLATRLAKIRYLSTSLRQEKDQQCSSLADQLDMAIFDIQQGQEQLESMQKLNDLSTQIAERSKLPGNDLNSLQPMFFVRGGIFVGNDGGLPYRY